MDKLDRRFFQMKDLTLKSSATLNRRRGTIAVTSDARLKTAVGLVRPPDSYLRRSSFTKRNSLTAMPHRKSDAFEQRGLIPDYILSRRASLATPKQKTQRSGSEPSPCINVASFYQPRLSLRRGSLQIRSQNRAGNASSPLKKSKIPILTEEDDEHIKKTLLAKFKLAVKLTIFCSRNFKDHCLRINENNDELAPYIKRLHFHEEQNTDDLLIDLSKFKANRQMRVPEIIKTILSKQQHERTDQELYQVVLALRNLKSLAEYPNRMQRKIAEVGLYEKYDSKRVIVRQNHPASAFYIILSGAVVVMVMEEDSKYARPVSHLYKGMTFGDLAIINGTKRQSTVICKETCEFLSISAQDYHKIFMAGGVKTLNDPDQEIFLKSLSCLADWPIHILPENPKKCQFLYFKNRDVIVRDSHFSDWLIIVKSGSVQVLKKLKRVEAFEWKKKKPVAPMTSKERRDVMLQRLEWRRFLPEMGVPMAKTEEVEMLDNGRVAPFRHPEVEEQETPRRENSSRNSPRIPSLWPLKIDLSEMKSSSGPRLGHHGIHAPAQRTKSFNERDRHADWKDLVRKPKTPETKSLHPPVRDRSASLAFEEEHELLGYQPHVRTIIEDIDAGIKRRDDTFIEEKDINPEFVHVQTLLKGQVFGLTDLIFGDQPSFSIISAGADCLLLDKNFYKDNASEKLLRDVRQELCPYPSEQELQERLQISVDWQQYKKVTLLKSLEAVSSNRLMRNTLNGTKSQDAFAY